MAFSTSSLRWAAFVNSATGNYTGAGVVALGNGHGTFGSAVLYPAGVPTLFAFLGKGTIVAVGDLGNGAQDIVVASSGQQRFYASGRLELVGEGLFVLIGNGDGTFKSGRATWTTRGLPGTKASAHWRSAISIATTGSTRW